MSRVCLIQLDGGEAGRQDEPKLSLCNIAEPLGLLAIDAYLRQEGHDVLFLHRHVEAAGPVDDAEILRRAVTFRPDLVAFSAMTNQIPASRRAAARIREACPEPIFLLGGDHIAGYPDSLADLPEFDLAIAGEGELGASLVARRPAREYDSATAPPGLYWKQDGQVRGEGRATRIDDLDRLPFATRFAGLLTHARVGPLMWPARSAQTGMVSVYASRGCPYACTYCDARQVWGKGVTWRDPARIVDELRSVRDRYGVNTAFFVDLTFNADRDRMMAVCSALAEARLGLSWYVLLRPGNPNDRITVDSEMLLALHEAGCVKIGFGVETIDANIGREYRRKAVNLHLAEVLSEADRHGMLTKVFVILGHPQEDEVYYHELEAFLEDLQADEVRISFLTPFPGTALWYSYRDRIDPAIGYECYTTFRPLLPHPLFSVGELVTIRHNLLRSYYTSERYSSRIRRKIERFPRLEDSYSEFLDVVEESLFSPTMRASLRDVVIRKNRKPIGI